MKKTISALLLSGSLVGCASLPDVRISYFPPKARSSVVVTRTFACNKSGTDLVTIQTVAITTNYSADRSAPPFTIDLKRLDGAFSDSDVTVELTEDGRLKGLNAISTGEGEAIVKSVVTLVATIGSLGLMGLDLKTGERLPPNAACKVVKDWGRGKPVTATYSASLDWNALATGAPTPSLEADEGSKKLDQLLASSLQPLSLRIDAPGAMEPAASYSGTEVDSMILLLNRIATVPVTVLAGTEKIGGGAVVVPTKATYGLPIPRSLLFGKETFSLALSDAGAITKVQYAKVAGFGAAANAANSIATAFKPPSVADQVAELKARADLIAQQERLAACTATPDDCPR